MIISIQDNDIHQALNEWAKNEFTLKNIKHSPKEEFIQYLNYSNKLISVQSRKVSFSSEFNISQKNTKGFQQLKMKLEKGENVNSYLSKLIRDAEYIDYLLDGYGIKHFHLGVSEKNGITDRTGELALGLVTNSEVFFVIAKEHGDDTWHGKDVLEVLHRERPDLISHAKIRHMTDISPKINSVEDIRLFRKNQISIAITLDDGTAYFPYDLGPTTAGYSSSYTFKLINLSNAIKNHINGDIIPKLSYFIHKLEVNIINFVIDKQIEFCLSITYIENNQLLKENITLKLITEKLQ